MMLVICCGCQFLDPDPVQLLPVGGIVILDGQPLADAKVLFVPQDKDLGHRFATSYAITDDNGRFELRLSDNRSGAYAGWHYVLVSKPKEGSRTPTIEPISTELDLDEFIDDHHDVVPRYYNVETELKFEVVPGRINRAEFELSSVDPLLK